MSIRCWMGFHKWGRVVMRTDSGSLHLCSRCDDYAWLEDER